MGRLLDRLAACEIIWPLVRSFGRLLHRLTMCCWPLARSLPTCSPVGRLLAHHLTLLNLGAPFFFYAALFAVLLCCIALSIPDGSFIFVVN